MCERSLPDAPGMMQEPLPRQVERIGTTLPQITERSTAITQRNVIMAVYAHRRHVAAIHDPVAIPNTANDQCVLENLIESLFVLLPILRDAQKQHLLHLERWGKSVLSVSAATLTATAQPHAEVTSPGTALQPPAEPITTHQKGIAVFTTVWQTMSRVSEALSGTGTNAWSLPSLFQSVDDGDSVLEEVLISMENFTKTGQKAADAMNPQQSGRVHISTLATAHKHEKSQRQKHPDLQSTGLVGLACK